MVAAGIRRHVLRQPAEEPGLLLGFRQPLHVRPGLRVPGYLPGLLPAGQDRDRQGRCAAADIPWHTRPVRSPHSRFMFVLAYAFLVTYQAYYLLDKIGTAKADVPQQIFLGTLAQSVVLIAASLIGGKLS